MNDVEFHSLHWDNFSSDMLLAHQKVMQHFNIDVKYHAKNIKHGKWLNSIFANATKPIIAIIEPDLIPLTPDIVTTAIEYVQHYDSFLGPAQASNHIYPGSHIFAAPSFFFMSRECYKRMGQPSFASKKHFYDVGENVSYRAEKLGIRYRTLLPTHFEKMPREGAWSLASLGNYGIGTVFDNSVYHLFQSRLTENIELFIRRCDEVIEGRFSTKEFYSSTEIITQCPLAQLPKQLNFMKRIWYSIK